MSVLAAVSSEDYRGFSAELAPGLDNTDGNAHFYGCEVRYDGGQPMTPKQYAAAVRWAAAICHHYGWSALSVIGHREWTRRKSDPGNCPMTKFRTDVAALLKAGPPKAVTPPASTGGTVARTLNDEDGVYIRALVQAELEEYGARLWGSTGTAGVFMKRTGDTLADHTLRLQRIEDDTDDGTV